LRAWKLVERSMIQFKTLFGAAVLALSLSACGSTQGDRTLSGVGIGAGIGAVGAAVTGGRVGTGAGVGAVAGGVVGATTTKDDINLGKPVWRKSCTKRYRNGKCRRR
jgi:osmotically inducible lipoprotein OsmB